MSWSNYHCLGLASAEQVQLPKELGQPYTRETMLSMPGFGGHTCVLISLLPALTFTCSLEVTAQKTISVKPWVGNMRKQMPPITRPSLISARVLCFLQAAWPRVRGAPHTGPLAPPSHARVKDEASDVLLGHAGQLV